MEASTNLPFFVLSTLVFSGSNTTESEVMDRKIWHLQWMLWGTASIIFILEGSMGSSLPYLVPCLHHLSKKFWNTSWATGPLSSQWMSCHGCLGPEKIRSNREFYCKYSHSVTKIFMWNYTVHTIKYTLV